MTVSSSRVSTLRHWYAPWSLTGIGHPPKGAVAVCGWVKETDTETSVAFDHPDACKVCVDIARHVAEAA